eukprot:362094-Chlamydomonas_euryale.AAC.12
MCIAASRGLPEQHGCSSHCKNMHWNTHQCTVTAPPNHAAVAHPALQLELHRACKVQGNQLGDLCKCAQNMFQSDEDAKFVMRLESHAIKKHRMHRVEYPAPTCMRMTCCSKGRGGLRHQIIHNEANAAGT